MTTGSPNPYGVLVQQLRALLQVESRMAPAHRRGFEWVLRAEFVRTSCTVIKGGANTIVLQLGERRLDPCFPEDALRLLSQLRQQPYPVYEVWRGGAHRRYHVLAHALETPPHDGDRIAGVDDAGRHLAYRARANTVGAIAWIAARASR